MRSVGCKTRLGLARGRKLDVWAVGSMLGIKVFCIRIRKAGERVMNGVGYESYRVVERRTYITYAMMHLSLQSGDASPRAAV